METESRNNPPHEDDSKSDQESSTCKEGSTDQKNPTQDQEGSTDQKNSTQDQPELFTNQWVDWLRDALADNHVEEDITVTIENCVTIRDGSHFCWHVRLANGRIEVRNGRAADNEPEKLTFKSDYDTARAMLSGGKTVQEAFLEGKLRMGGDIRKLIAAYPALNSLSLKKA